MHLVGFITKKTESSCFTIVFSVLVQYKLQTVLKIAACIYQPLSVQYLLLLRVYPSAQELRWKQQFYWYKGNTVAVTSFVWRWNGSCYLFYVPFCLLLLSPCFHMNRPFMEVFLQRVTAIFNRFYAHNLSWKWKQVLQTVSPVMFKMFQGHMYTRWCRKCFFIVIVHSVQVASTSSTVTPAIFSGYFARGSFWNDSGKSLPHLRHIPLWGFFSFIYFLIVIFFNYVYLASIVSKVLNTVLPSTLFCGSPNFLFGGYVVAFFFFFFFPVMRQKELRLTTYPQLMSRLAIRGTISLLAPYAFMKWTLHVLAFGFHLALRWLSCNLMECVALYMVQTRKNAIFSVEHSVYFIQW